MARSLWSGSLSFGLVNVPVQLFSAVRDLDVHFSQLHEKDGAPIETRRFCAEEDGEVPYEEVGHGYELDDGDQVVLTDEELATAAPRKTRTIDIEAFVDLADVDPIHFDHPYFLLPAGDSGGHQARLPAAGRGHGAHGPRGARALRHAHEGVPRDRPRPRRPARADDDALPRRDPPRQGHPDGRARSRRRPQLDRRVALIEALAADWDPSQYEDRYRERLLDVVKRKKKGKRITVPDDERQPHPCPT